jgi:hypothetical protein
MAKPKKKMKMTEQLYWHGSAVSQEHRDAMAQEIFDELQQSKEFSDWACSMTGDCLVLGVKEGRGIEITDCIVRRHTAYYIDLPKGK